MKYTILVMFLAYNLFGETKEVTQSWYYPKWVAKAPYNNPIIVKDTDSALGRYNIRTKELNLKTMVKVHGHLCDGLTLGWIELSYVLKKLFPDGVVDRTDVRVVSKNSPCLVDAGATMTGARINFKTLSLDNSLAGGYIVERISTGETYEVHLKEGLFPVAQEDLEHQIRDRRKAGENISAEEIDTVEQMADDLTRKLLYTAPEKLLVLKKLQNYKFQFSTKDFGKRSDIINKNMPR